MIILYVMEIVARLYALQNFGTSEFTLRLTDTIRDLNAFSPEELKARIRELVVETEVSSCSILGRPLLGFLVQFYRIYNFTRRCRTWISYGELEPECSGTMKRK